MREADARFWKAYNDCDPTALGAAIDADVEFYHDAGGVTRSRAALVESVMTNICGTPGAHVRREADAASVIYDPVPGYGAVLSGEHRFFRSVDGAPEQQTAVARFLMLWRYAGGRWQAVRVFSLGHHQPDYRPPAAAITPSAAQLARLTGRYRTDTVGDVVVSVEQGELVLRAGELRLTLRARTSELFFAVERDLLFAFSGGDAGKAGALTVYEGGAVAARGARAD